MAIGIVGIGNMGRPIAEYLSEVGAELVLWNRSGTKADGVANSSIAQTPAMVVAGCDVILSVLANDTAIDHVYRGPCKGWNAMSRPAAACSLNVRSAAMWSRRGRDS